jgi:hypothetical protein
MIGKLSRPKLPRHGIAWWTALLLFATGVRGESLRELAPADAGLYVELHHLAADAERFQGGDLFARWQRHPLWHLAKLKVEGRWKPVRDFLGLSNDHWWLQLLGDEAVLAVWPGEHTADPGTALIMVRTREHELLERIVRRAGEDAVRRDANARQELTIDDHKLTVYKLHTKRDPREVRITIVRRSDDQPSFGIMTSRPEAFESVVRGVLQSKASDSSKAEQPTVRISLRPRPWDALIHSTPQPAEPRARRGRQLVEETWHAFDGATLNVSLTEQVRGELNASWQAKKLPSLVSDLIGGLTGSTELASHTTDEALVAVGGRLDLGRWLRSLMAAGPSEPSLVNWPKEFEFHLALSLVTGLGPDWVGALVATPQDSSAEKPSWPIDWLAGTETRALGSNSSPKLGPVLVPLVQQALRFAETAALSRNGDSPARTETIEADDRVLLKLTGVPQTGPHEAIVLTESSGVIWAGSSVASVQQAGKASDAKWLEQVKQLAGDKSFGRVSHFAIADLASLRRVLESSTHGPRRLAEVRKIELEQAERDLKTMSRLLDVADRVAAAASVSGDGVKFVGEIVAEKKN